MAGIKRCLVKISVNQKKQSPRKKNNEKDEQGSLLVNLVNVVRNSRKKDKSDDAFLKITEILKTKIDQLVYKFRIPGHNQQDIKQEALFALRYKAIKDYDQTRSTIKKVSPFDKFAMLCMRRHLSTRLKASFQNKSIALNRAVSIDSDRGSFSRDEENLFLSDIILHPDGDVSESTMKKEVFYILMRTLYVRLSDFEKQVLKLYSCKYSYNEIAEIIYGKGKNNQAAIKSIDNSLSRIKLKGKDIITEWEEKY